MMHLGNGDMENKDELLVWRWPTRYRLQVIAEWGVGLKNEFLTPTRTTTRLSLSHVSVATGHKLFVWDKLTLTSNSLKRLLLGLKNCFLKHGQKTVADRHRLAAYYNKHCWRAFQWYQHRWPWTTLNSKNRGFSEFLAILGCNTHFKRKLRRNRSR